MQRDLEPITVQKEVLLALLGLATLGFVVWVVLMVLGFMILASEAMVRAVF